MRLMNAIAAGPVAEPAVAESVRNKIIVVAFHAMAVSAAKIDAPRRPRRKRRLWPHRSPALPKAGPTTPKASIGPVSAQLMVDVSEFKSVATVSSETTRMVIVALTANSPERTTMSVAHARLRPMRLATLRTNRFPRTACQGSTPTSSTPGPCSCTAGAHAP